MDNQSAVKFSGRMVKKPSLAISKTHRFSIRWNLQKG